MRIFSLLFALGCSPTVKPGCDSGCETGDSQGGSGETGETGDTSAPDSGETNETGDSQESADTWDPDAPLELCINEFMSDNKTSLTDETGATPDWIELHNPGADEVALAGWTMTDDADETDKSELDDTLVIEAHGFLVFYADNLPDLGTQHLGFSLSQDGGTVGLYAPDGRGSLLQYAWIASDLSAARVPDCCSGDGCWDYVYQGTPGVTNG